MSATEEKPLSTVIAEAITGCSPFAPGDFEHLVINMTINEGHDNIIMAIDNALKKNPQGGKRAALERIKEFILAQKAEAKKRVADADKIKALRKLVIDMGQYVPVGLTGQHAVDMGKFILKFNEFSSRIERAKSAEEFQQILAELG